MSKLRPRRSCLYMPGANAKALEKAKTLAADVLIFDLEDSVAPEAKTDARSQIVTALTGGGYGAREIVVRINGFNTPWGRDDMRAAALGEPAGVLAPKVESGVQVTQLDEAMEEAGFPETAQLWVMIETPRAIMNLDKIALAARETRLAGFVMGTNDLAKETRAKLTPERTAFHAALSLAVTSARMAGIVAIDGVYNDIPNMEGFAAECRQGVEFGFDGKTLIHPSQIETCNNLFAPSADEVARARAVIAAFADPENAGKGVLKVDGKMTELLHLAEAKRIVAVAEAIQAAA